MRQLLLVCCLLCINGSLVFAQDVDTLLGEAKSLIDAGKPTDSVLLFHQVLQKDSSNYESLSFLGNYYYLTGKKYIDKADMDFQSIAQPNHMQLAQHQDQLKLLYGQYYEKANTYLKRALAIRENDHLNQLVSYIYAFKVRIGLVSVKPRFRSKFKI